MIRLECKVGHEFFQGTKGYLTLICLCRWHTGVINSINNKKVAQSFSHNLNSYQCLLLATCFAFLKNHRQATKKRKIILMVCIHVNYLFSWILLIAWWWRFEKPKHVATNSNRYKIQLRLSVCGSFRWLTCLLIDSFLSLFNSIKLVLTKGKFLLWLIFFDDKSRTNYKLI